MKLFIVFDANASSYEVSGQAANLGNISGVKSVVTLEAVAGKVPRYCIQLKIEDENAQATGAKVKEALSPYSSYMSNVVWGAYKKI